MRVVIAIGGNALGDNLDEQMRAVKTAAVAIVDLVESGHEIVLIHGNGPQIGMIETAFETAAAADHSFPVLPISVCVALSQGYIGYDLQNALGYELEKRKIAKTVVTLITQVAVDPEDAAFNDPSKPIGGFLDARMAEKLRREGISVIEDSGRGYRRVVASPRPVDVIEKEAIVALLDAGEIPIAAGGGGIPVAKVDGQYRGICAVIDKDRAAAKLAELIGADMLIILTAVEKVALRFGKPDQEELDHLTAAEAESYMSEGHFGKGSMLPKVEAAVDFVRSGDGKKALITMLSKAREGIEGETGTVITLK
jgi:carbamate kinase